MTRIATDWSSVAPGWDRFRDDVENTEQDVTARLLDELPALAGKRVLELGAGTGELAARLAEAVGPAGSVLASDAAEGMVELLHARLDGLPGVQVARIDALDIPLDADSVDVVVFRMGLMLTLDADRALGEIHRVLRAGGRFAAAVWGPPHLNPWLTAVGIAALTHGLAQGGPPVGPGEPFSLTDADDLTRRLEAVGFGSVQVTPVDSVRRHPDADRHFDMVRALAPPLAAAFDAASDEQVAAVRATASGLLAQYRTPAGLMIPMQALVCSASA